MRVFNSLEKTQRPSTHCSSLATLEIFTAVFIKLYLPSCLICSLELGIRVQAEVAHLFNIKQMDFSYLLFTSIKGPHKHSLPKGTSTNFKTIVNSITKILF